MITLLIGASTDPTRYSNMCLTELAERHFPVEAIGLKEGEVAGIRIQTGLPAVNAVHTVTLYLSAKHQARYYQYILDLKPSRVIFNPGTENPEFETMLEEHGIDVLAACTIMMLHAGLYFDA